MSDTIISLSTDIQGAKANAQQTQVLDVVSSEEDMYRKVAADLLCKNIGKMLTRHYPGRRWHVEVNLRGGVAHIRLPDISMRYGITMHLARTVNELNQRTIHVGGEMLERFGLSRNQNATNDDIAHVPKNRITGEALKASTGG